MGDPRRLKKKYERPMHPWNKENMEVERVIKVEYALKNKQELWRANSFLRNLRLQAKKLIALRTRQADIEKANFLKSLQRLGLVREDAKLDDVLALALKDVLERRLQSRLFRLGLARSMSQARQFIVRNHVIVSGKKINAPGHLVNINDEITFYHKSTLSRLEHPERMQIAVKVEDKPEVKDEKPEVKDEKTVE